MEKHLQDTSGKEGQPCCLSCQLSVPNVEAQWFKNGERLEMKGRYSSEAKHKVQKLLIRDLRTEDQGRYTCRYQNLESSADLWVEGLYTGPLDPVDVVDALRALTSLDSSLSQTKDGRLLQPFFPLFLLGFGLLCLNPLHTSPLLSRIISQNQAQPSTCPSPHVGLHSTPPVPDNQPS